MIWFIVITDETCLIMSHSPPTLSFQFIYEVTFEAHCNFNQALLPSCNSEEICDAITETPNTPFSIFINEEIKSFREDVSPGARVDG